MSRTVRASLCLFYLSEGRTVLQHEPECCEQFGRCKRSGGGAQTSYGENINSLFDAAAISTISTCLRVDTLAREFSHVFSFLLRAACKLSDHWRACLIICWTLKRKWPCRCTHLCPQLLFTSSSRHTCTARWSFSLSKPNLLDFNPASFLSLVQTGFAGLKQRSLSHSHVFVICLVRASWTLTQRPCSLFSGKRKCLWRTLVSCVRPLVWTVQENARTPNGKQSPSNTFLWRTRAVAWQHVFWASASEAVF